MKEATDAPIGTSRDTDTFVEPRQQWTANWIRSIEAAAFAGLVFAVTSSVSLTILTSAPDPTTPDAEITAWYADTTNRDSTTIGLYLAVIAAISFLWFIAVIRRRVGDREDRFFATVFLGSGILLTGVMLIGSAVIASAAITADIGQGQILDPMILMALNGIGTTLLLVVLLRLQAVFIMATSTLTLRTRALNRWLSYLGYGIALIIFVMPIVREPIGLAFPIWVGILSAALITRKLASPE